jgi:hypothetical protein
MEWPAVAPQSHLFRTGPAAPDAQHRHRVDVRGRPPLPLHDPRRLHRLDPGAVIRPEPGEWHPHMPAQLDEEELADWRAAAARSITAALTIGARLAVADA